MGQKVETNGTDGTGAPYGVRLSLQARPERRLIRIGGSARHVDFWVKVETIPDRAAGDRLPLNLALVLDRSGSMAGEKLSIGKYATLAVLEKLDERDRAAVVIFDDRIHIIQRAAPVTALLKAHVQAELSRVQARASTALHEGWLTGYRAIAGDSPPEAARALARCYLLTDGLANVGLTDPEQIATEAAGVREQAGIGTSTFGIGPDYDEFLLGPLAAAGGGQFHHLRTSNEILRTFVGELRGLLAVAAQQVRLEIEASPGAGVDLISQYWAGPADSASRWSVTVGDLIGGQEQHVVVRFRFPASQGQPGCSVRGRVVWTADGAKHTSEWQEIQFTYADDHACNVEPRHPAAMHWIGLHHADRARREATALNQRGDLHGARERLRRVARRIREYAGNDSELRDAIDELLNLESGPSFQRRASSMAAKELTAEAIRRGRGEPDRRGPATG